VIKLLGSRGASAVMGIFMLALASSEASAQNLSGLNVPAAVKSIEIDRTARALGNAAGTLVRPVVAATTAVTLGNGTIIQAQPAGSVTLRLTPASIAQEASWLYRAGWPLYALVDKFGASAPQLDEQANCMAVAVYHEARGESLEGQLAVARVIMNRAASGKYPSSWCGTVKQPWQFSFVNPRSGAFPYTDTNCEAWRKAVGVTQLAIANAVPSVSTDVLWYHATYVAPSWGRRLSRAQQIGTHIFYRS
jgi:N-acetylmuramoyl-L-alanine amidase